MITTKPRRSASSPLAADRDVGEPGDDDQPRPRQISTEQMGELGAGAGAAAALVWVPFHLAGWNAPFGFSVGWLAAFTLIYAVVVRQRHGLLEMKDRLAGVFIMAGTVAALLPLVFIMVLLVRLGLPVVLIRFPHFLLHNMHGVGPRDPVSKAGMQQAIIGTLEQVGLATVASVPVGVLAATYLNEVGGRFAGVVRTVADAMTGLPTIISGLFVYSAWVLPRGINGWSGFAAAMSLWVVMLPVVVRTSEEVLRIVSDSLREAALALGAPEWRMVLRVVVPTARAGLITGAILSVARAVGETAPVALTAFGSPTTNLNPFRHPQADLPIEIYHLVLTANANNVKEAWGGAFLLVAMVLTLFSLARVLGTGGNRAGRSWIRSAIARLWRQVNPNLHREAS